MWNKPLDFCGYLSLLWRSDLQQDESNPVYPPPGVDASALDDDPIALYRAWSQLTVLPAQKPYLLLSPRKLVALGHCGHLTTA
ncbi:hypothetical protein N7462_006539 [Penicillium macrosclerotiorum]|uniref:uncharacterized protein n=1 Tax=Penicillium macrosclerotiorum TaxID=303699 RepID=UPI002547F33F|nr:uncharacterized protein N7462_006539 [Penicillium macrosclerotiorum]KAJ5683374.1 hypothetical protein N7462_006539 [Penicillium macrosclerotiorum]